MNHTKTWKFEPHFRHWTGNNVASTHGQALCLTESRLIIGDVPKFPFPLIGSTDAIGRHRIVCAVPEFILGTPGQFLRRMLCHVLWPRPWPFCCLD